MVEGLRFDRRCNMKYLFYMFFLLPVFCFAKSYDGYKDFTNECMSSGNELADLKAVNIIDSAFVDKTEEMLNFTRYKENYSSSQINVDAEKNIHDGKNNYNYGFYDGFEGAVFALGENKEAGNKILICAVIETKKINHNSLYIGQDFTYFKSKFGLVNDVDVLTVERGETSVVLYFKNRKLFKIHFFSEGYDG